MYGNPPKFSRLLNLDMQVLLRWSQPANISMVAPPTLSVNGLDSVILDDVWLMMKRVAPDANFTIPPVKYPSAKVPLIVRVMTLP